MQLHLKGYVGGDTWDGSSVWETEFTEEGFSSSSGGALICRLQFAKLTCTHILSMRPVNIKSCGVLFCSTCSERFISRSDLSRHNIRVHSNVKKRFKCEFRSAGFSQKSQLTMHKGRVHVPTKWTRA